MEKREYTVSEENCDIRIDRYLSMTLPDYSRSYLQHLIKDGLVLVNQVPVKANHKVTIGEQILLQIPNPENISVAAENIPLDILYEDSDLLVINKPKGMVVHPSAGHYTGTLVNALMYHLGDNLSVIGGVLRPGIVHRIDMNTTGSLLVCKNDFAHQHIAAQLKEHSITRTYHAITHGVIKEATGTIHAPIGRHLNDRKKMSIQSKNGKDAITHYQVLEPFRQYTYVKCSLETGRTHQIRVHLASIHHPLLGDNVYGPAKCPYPLQGQTLHAKVIGFIHPQKREYMEFEAPLPTYFNDLLHKLPK